MNVLFAELSLNAVLALPPGVQLEVHKKATASVSHRGEGGLDAQAVVDPVFAIAADFMVDYNGVPTLATDLYEIVYSPGITPVPAPPTGMLLVTGLSALGVRLRRRAATKLTRV